MRKYLFDFEQEAAMAANLDIKDLLLLDYLGSFFGSGRARKLRGTDGMFFRITYKKILEDLPILNFGERQLRQKILLLSDKGFIEKCNKYKNQQYIKLNLGGLYSSQRDSASITTAAPRELVIFCRRAVGKELDIECFEKFFFEALNMYVSSYSREQFMSDLVLEKVESGNFVFLSKNADFIGEHLLPQMKKSLSLAVKRYHETLERFKRAFVMRAEALAQNKF